MKLTEEDIFISSREARERISAQIQKTPLLPIILESHLQVYLKLENRQHTGSFKARGSMNKILKLSENHETRRVISASTGNHALGIARALKLTEIEGTIILPKNAAPFKINKLGEYPVDLEFVEGSSLDAELYARSKAEEENLIWISPYNDSDIIAGQGTIGFEIYSDLPQTDVVFVTVGGGGLVSGIAAVLRRLNPRIKIVGCQPKNSPEMKLSVEAGKIIDYPETFTLSDGSAGGIEPGAITFPICQQVIDQFCLISEDEIKESIRLIYRLTGEKIEGSAGVAVSGARKLLPQMDYKHAVVIICGGNIESSVFHTIIAE